MRSKIVRNFIGYLPRSVRHSIYRGMIDIEPRMPPELEVKIADTKEELTMAFRLLHDSYVEMSFMHPHPTGMRITPYHALPTTTIVVAKWNGEVVGTLSIISDGPFGLPIAADFDTRRLKWPGERCAEISALAIRKTFRGDKGRVLFPMFKFLYLYCRDYLNVRCLQVVTSPTRVDFYKALLFFENVEDRVIADSFVNGAEMTALYLDLEMARKKMHRSFSGKSDRKDLLKYFLDTQEPQLKFPQRKYFSNSDPVLTPDLLNYFFNEQRDILRHLDSRQRQTLHSLYPAPQYKNVLPSLGPEERTFARRIDMRFTVGVVGRVGISEFFPARVTQVSKGGLAAVIYHPMSVGDVVHLEAQISETTVAHLDVRCVHLHGANTFGFEIINPSPAWHQMINEMTQQQLKSDAEQLESLDSLRTARS